MQCPACGARTGRRGALADVDLYKVGHHGSRNATPRSLFNLWNEDPDPQRPMVALMSTLSGVFGKSEKTRVPRATLVAALDGRSSDLGSRRLRKSRRRITLVQDDPSGLFDADETREKEEEEA